MHADLTVRNAAQLLTLASPEGPKRGRAMGDVGLIEDGTVAVSEGRIVWVGPSAEAGHITADTVIDATGRVVMPGFVDPHTHLLWAGDRADEFEMRIAGATYMEIMAAGGGIMNTVHATRAASLDELLSQTPPRLDALLAHGTTTAEVKTGYGLDTQDELKMLEAIHLLDQSHPLELVPTFLGAHAVPAEYQGRADEYVDLVIEEMLPQAARSPHRPAFCDVFCEDGAFDLEQSRRILEAARALGLGLKIHVDEFEALGGTRLAVELGAVSADHLACTPPEEIELLARSSTIAVSLPGTPFGLGDSHYTPARAIVDGGGALALATDLNPGTCYCQSMPFVVALACRYLRITPAEAICAATINAAHAIGLGHEVGSLEIGKKADVIILDLPTFQHLPYRFGTNPVQTVIKAGQMVKG